MTACNEPKERSYERMKGEGSKVDLYLGTTRFLRLKWGVKILTLNTGNVNRIREGRPMSLTKFEYKFGVRRIRSEFHLVSDLHGPRSMREKEEVLFITSTSEFPVTFGRTFGFLL